MNLQFSCKKLLFRTYPKLRILFFKQWNHLKFHFMGIDYGKNLVAFNRIHLSLGRNSKVKIGENFRFTSGDAINPLCRNIEGCIKVNNNGILKIGNNTGMSSTCLWVHEKVTIGNYVKIGGDVIIMDSDAHSLNFLDRRKTRLDMENKFNMPIVIEDDVLIGAKVIILKGVHIGARSVIGSGSVVTKDIPADCIAAGNPCKVIRFLDPDNEKTT